MPEGGWLMLVGMRMEVSFYKELFDKIGVKADMLQMGDYKGAAEPFTRTNLSEPNKKQLDRACSTTVSSTAWSRASPSRAQKWTASR